MDSIEVIGGQPLSGDLYPQGAKNEALQIVSAVLLTDDVVTISNVPDILDVNKLIELLRGLGVTVERLSEDTYRFCAGTVDINYLRSEEFMRDAQRLRGSVMLIGPLLARFGRATLPKPGGDKIGRRRLDTHFLGFQKLGAEFKYDDEKDIYYVEQPKEGLRGTYLHMDEISVTGTANIVMAAVLAKGKTTIYNAACEPYLQQLCSMLNRMGAKISGIGDQLCAHPHGIGDRAGRWAHTGNPVLVGADRDAQTFIADQSSDRRLHKMRITQLDQESYGRIDDRITIRIDHQHR